jgi:hypothetical protein
MSPSEPAGNAKRKNGKAEAVWIKAMKRELLVSVVINHAAPTVCMKAPISETRSAISRLRKSGMRRGRHGLVEGWETCPPGSGIVH